MMRHAARFVVGAVCLLGVGWMGGVALTPACADEVPALSDSDAHRHALMKAMQSSVTTIRDALKADSGGQNTAIAKRMAAELDREARMVAKYPPQGNSEFAGLATKLAEDAGELSRVQGDDLDLSEPAAAVYTGWEALQAADKP